MSSIKQHHWTLEWLCCKCHCKSAMFSVHWGDKEHLGNSYGYGENLSHMLISTACPRVHIKKATKAWRNTHCCSSKDPLEDLRSVGTTSYRASAHVLKPIKKFALWNSQVPMTWPEVKLFYKTPRNTNEIKTFNIKDSLKCLLIAAQFYRKHWPERYCC